VATITSNGTGGGNWSAGASWAGGVAPVLGTDDAIIAAGDTVTIDTTGLGCGTDPGALTDGLTINGTLKYAAGVNSALEVRGGITVASGGTFYDGTQLPIAYQHVLKVDCVDASDKYRLNISDGGIFKPYGTTVTTPWASLSGNVSSGQKVVATSEDISDWAVGDYVFLPTTTALQYSQGEIRIIQSIDTAYQFTVTANWTYTHLKNMETWMPDCACLNLSRNVRIEPSNTTYPFAIRNKSQTMANFNLKNTELRHMGTANTNRSLVFCNSDATPSHVPEAFGYVDGSTFHPGTGGYGKPGFYFSTYGSTGDNVTHSDNFFIGTYANEYLASCVNYCAPTLFERCVFAHQTGLYATYIRALQYLAGDVEGYKDCLFAGLYSGTAYVRDVSKLATYDNTNNVFQCCRYGIYIINNYQDFSGARVAGGQYGIRSAEGAINNPNMSGVHLKSSINDVYTSGHLYFDESYSHGVFDVGLRPAIGLHFHKLDGEAENHYSFLPYGNIASTKSTFASPRDIALVGMAAMLEPVDASNDLEYAFSIAAEDDKQISVTGRIRRTSAYNGATEPVINLTGVGMTTSTYTMSGGADQWELFSVSGLPTEDGVAKLTISCIGTAGYVYFDNLQVLAADVNTGDLNNWIDGQPAPMLFATKVDADQLAVSVADAVLRELIADHKAVAGSLAEFIDVTRTQTDKMNFSGDNIQARVADKGALNNPPSESIADYKADVSGLAPASEYDTAISDLQTDSTHLLKIIENKKELKKNGDVWELIIYDDDGTTPILNKEIKDADGNDITDLAAGTLAQELANSV